MLKSVGGFWNGRALETVERLELFKIWKNTKVWNGPALETKRHLKRSGIWHGPRFKTIEDLKQPKLRFGFETAEYLIPTETKTVFVHNYSSVPVIYRIQSGR